MISWIQNHKITSLIIIFTIIFIGISSYVTFKPESPIAKTYFIDNFKRAVITTNEESIQPTGVLAPASIITITAASENIQSISVKPGQTIAAGDELIVFNTSATDQQIANLESELVAYETELSSLENILFTLQSAETTSYEPNSFIDAFQNETELTMQIDLLLQSDTSLSGAISVIESQIAATNRQIEITSNRLAQIDTTNSEVAPFDAAIATVENIGGQTAITLYSIEKSVLTYLTEDLWRKIEPSQYGEIELQEDAQLVAVDVVNKSPIPADFTTTWGTNFAQQQKSIKDNTYYEIELTPTEPLNELPYASIVPTKIIMQQAFDSYNVNKDWLISSTEIDESGDKLVVKNQNYLNDLGVIAQMNSDIQFIQQGRAIVINSIPEQTPLLNATDRKIGSRAFISYPMTQPSWKEIKDTNWRSLLIYMLNKQ